jgi:uncharacterized RDD family membrane protein YckC
MASPDWYRPPTTEPTRPVEGAPPSSAVPAGFGIRVGARVIDGLVGGLIATVVGMATLLLTRMVGDSALLARVGRAGFAWPSFFVGMAGGLAAQTCYEGFGGATVGKLALGLRVRSVNLSPCRPGAAFLRNLLYFVDAMFFGLVAYNAMSKSPMRQRVGDKSARTVVVRAASLPPEARAIGPGIALGLVVDVLGSVMSEAVKIMG